MNIEQARIILSKKAESMSDDEIQKIIDLLWTVCSIMIESKISNK